jgi:TolB-like protein/Flp pilus assembly protein TadD
MERESPSQASTPARAVFLSYASQDARAAKRICEALRAAGIDVWFDQSELRGGDAWDRQIRAQIHECRLFMPIVSAHTEARVEGYFRREWKLAVDRTHDLSDRVAFLVPVVIDSTTELKADVPDAFRHIQWTRLPGGEPSSAFVDRVRRLLSPDASPGQAAANSVPAPRPAVTKSSRPLGSSWPSTAGFWLISAVLAVGLAYLVAERFWISKHSPAPAVLNTNAPPATAAAFNPPPHSIAVLPFVNMSGDKEQEYFSEGLTEELLNSLSRISELQVAARTSSFSFQGEHPDIATVAHKLNVGSVLEGSVRRSAHTIRVTTQLNNAITGFHLWSQTYDRDLGDVLELQADIADAVATALKVTLLGDVAAKIGLGGTRNPVAFDAYLRARRADIGSKDIGGEQAAIAAYTEAIRLDPTYALAFAGRSNALARYAQIRARGAEIREDFDRAQSDAHKAVALAPELAEGHLALAVTLEAALDFPRASEEYERALALAPGNEWVLQYYGAFATSMGHLDAGLAAARRAVTLDPLNRGAHWSLSSAMKAARRYDEAILAYKDAAALSPDDQKPAILGLIYYARGDYQKARSLCEIATLLQFRQRCLAMTYDQLGRHADAEAMLAKLRAEMGDSSAYEYALIYAQWGYTTRALEWLETAMRLRDPGLSSLKINALLDPLRKEPRFQAIQRALKFPD